MIRNVNAVAGVLLALSAFAVEAQPATIAVNSRATYLRTSNDAAAQATVPINLASLGLKPGDTIALRRLGDFNCTATCGDISTGMAAVFSSSSSLLASSQQHRVPGAIDAGVDIVTGPTFFNALPTDIPHDFEVPGGGVTIVVPAAAAFLFVAGLDSFYGDNGDPDGDFAVTLEQLPVANAGPDQSVSEGAMVTLDGSGSTGKTLRYAWVQVAGPPAELNQASGSNLAFTAPPLPGGFGSQVLTFQLTVTSGTRSSSDIVEVTVRNLNRAPVADGGADLALREGVPVTLDGSASFDPDGDPFTYQWMQTAGTPVVLNAFDTARPTFVAPLVPGGTGPSERLTFELTVFDGALASTDTVAVEVQQINQAPLANAGADQTVDEGSVVTLDGGGSADPDGDSITSYVWSQAEGPPVELSNAGSARPSFTAPATGPGGAALKFELAVSDGLLGSTTDLVVVNVLNANDPPLCAAARASPERLWPPNHKMVTVRVAGVADPDNDQVRIAINGVTQDEPVNGLGDGDTAPDAVIAADAVLLRAERSGNGNGRVYHVHFTANDSQGGSCSGSVTVGVPHSGKAADTAAHDGQLHNSTLP